jgi:hypothetical protein
MDKKRTGKKKVRTTTSPTKKKYKPEVPKSPTPMWLRFINRETGVTELLNSFVKSMDTQTAGAAQRALENPPDLEEFRQELEAAARDLVRDGVGEEFKAFVNHYMDSLEEDLQVQNTPRGENRSQTARVKDENGSWIQGFICYNLTLYIKAFGLGDVKECKICGKVFSHKGEYAVYCSEKCKSQKDQKRA